MAAGSSPAEGIQRFLNEKNKIKFRYMEDYTLTPYDILGICENARLGDIQAAYRNLVRLVHPDKRISTWMSKKESEAAFQQIRAAYKTLLKQKKFKEEDAPHDEINYEISNELLCSSSTVKFDINDFNKRFKEVHGKLHYQDPENKGYSSFNHSRDGNNQLDGPQFLPFKETEMVIYEDPEPTTGSITTSCQELGLLEIEDFGIGITTDLGVAFSKDSFVSTKEYKKMGKEV